MDDTFCIFQDKVQAENFLLYLNQQHHNVSFTRKFEVNDSLSLLDVVITHTDKVSLPIYIVKKRLQSCILILTVYHL